VEISSEQRASDGRVQLLSQAGSIGASMLELESLIDETSGLDATVREIAVMTVLRRSRTEVAARKVAASEAGVTDEMLEAILAEDWTDPCFDAVQKAAFQFALQYDAGHLINSTVFEAVRSAFDQESIIKLALVCSHYGAMARLAVGFQLDATSSG